MAGFQPHESAAGRCAGAEGGAARTHASRRSRLHHGDPHAGIRRCTSMPTYPSSISLGSPVWIAIAIRTCADCGHCSASSARCRSAAAATASRARRRPGTRRPLPNRPHAPALGGRGPDELADPGVDVRIALAEGVQEPRRALDVGEQQGHGSGGEASRMARASAAPPPAAPPERPLDSPSYSPAISRSSVRVLRQDRLFELAERAVGLDSELVHERRVVAADRSRAPLPVSPSGRARASAGL